MVQTATPAMVRAAGESRCGRLILEIRVRVPGGPLKHRRRPAARGAVLEQRFYALGVLRGQYRVQQTREAAVQVFVAQREHSLAAVGAGSDHAAFA